MTLSPSKGRGRMVRQPASACAQPPHLEVLHAPLQVHDVLRLLRHDIPVFPDLFARKGSKADTRTTNSSHKDMRAGRWRDLPGARPVALRQRFGSPHLEATSCVRGPLPTMRAERRESGARRDGARSCWSLLLLSRNGYGLSQCVINAPANSSPALAAATSPTTRRRRERKQ